MEKKVDVFPVEKLSGVHAHDDDRTVVVVTHPDGTDFGFLLPPDVADELTGALIERPISGYGPLGSSEGSTQDVQDHTFEQTEDDAYELKMTGSEGTILTFQMGTRRVRRIRDAMTAHIVRHDRKHGSQ